MVCVLCELHNLCCFFIVGSVLEVLLAESHLIGGLTGLGLSVSDTHSVVQIPVHSQVQSFAVDMRGPSVVVSSTVHTTVEPLIMNSPNSEKPLHNPYYLQIMEKIIGCFNTFIIQRFHCTPISLCMSHAVLLTLMLLMVCYFLQFINDLESDRQYAGWPKSLRQVSIM